MLIYSGSYKFWQQFFKEDPSQNGGTFLNKIKKKLNVSVKGDFYYDLILNKKLNLFVNSYVQRTSYSVTIQLS